jgi:hypothetical protein
MLHPDSHNMFDNGSFLRRRRRFKQEAANGSHRTHQHNGSGRQRNQLHQRNSPSLISPTSTSTNNVLDSRPNGAKSSRSRNHALNSVTKESPVDDVDCLESPRKVEQTLFPLDMIVKFVDLYFLSSTFRNMPVAMSHPRWNRSKRANRVITCQRTACRHHRLKRHL